jgi:ABC-type phosphate transport system substrate-binding protein
MNALRSPRLPRTSARTRSAVGAAGKSLFGLVVLSAAVAFPAGTSGAASSGGGSGGVSVPTTTLAPGSSPTTTVPTVGSTTTTTPGSTSTTTTTTTTSTTTSTTVPSRGKPGTEVSASLAGNGSSFAAPAVTNWTDAVGQSPYNLNIVYTPSSSGQGRYEFTNETVDYAVSDTGYVNSSVGGTAPSFPYDFIPITAAGVAFMYNIPGLTQTLQLTSYTACLLLTGQITNWDNPALKQSGANAGVTLPNLPVKPVTESDPAGTNYVLEEYCIDEQPAVWAQYARNMSSTPPASGVPISATSPGSNWQAPGNGYDEQSTSAVASNVANNVGAIGAVQENYATDSGFTGTNPAHGVASVQNASGKFALPTPVGVASALAYASQTSDGTHKLDFNGLGPNVYNPSTYSYLLTPTRGANGFPASKGTTMSNFVNYVLTLGQKAAPGFGYASLGLSLERYGIDQVIAGVPGAVDPTPAEDQAYACGDLTPTEVQAGQTTPTCGVTNGSPPPAPPGEAAVHTVNGASSGADGAGGAGGAAGGGSGGGGSAGGVDPAVSLSGSSPLAFTGFDPLPLVFGGLLMVITGLFVRRQLAGKRKRSAQ